MSLLTSTRDVFFNPRFTEQVTYQKPSGASRTIVAIVQREQPQSLPEVGTTLAAFNVVEVRNVEASVSDDGYGGIALSELNLDGDSLSFPVREGGTPERRKIAQILKQDAGVLTLEVR